MSPDCYIRCEANNMTWLGSTLTIVRSLSILELLLVRRPLLMYFGFLIMTFHIEDLPYIVCTLPFLTADSI